ncbi:MAG: zinc ABC transporter substrate-binding protein [Proteobacteria bacterium]|nr:zinc ABC transporter substrate-binding protein [Pseudomonadota bacterium]
MVVASIPPLHSLTAGVMEGVGAPALIIRSATSAHHHVLRPSEAPALHRAEIVIWIGEALEAFLAKPIPNHQFDPRSQIDLVAVRERSSQNRPRVGGN